MKEEKAMVSKNNFQNKMQQNAERVPHYGLRKLSLGVASVLLSTILYFEISANASTTEPGTVEGEPQNTVVAQTPEQSNASEQSSDKIVDGQRVTVKQTIHYQNEDGDTVAPDCEQTIEFRETKHQHEEDDFIDGRNRKNDKHYYRETKVTDKYFQFDGQPIGGGEVIRHYYRTSTYNNKKGKPDFSKWTIDDGKTPVAKDTTRTVVDSTDWTVYKNGQPVQGMDKLSKDQVHGIFDDVPSPKIDNYVLADDSQATIKGNLVNLDAQRQTDIIVVYKAAKKRATIKYIDDTGNKILSSDNSTGTLDNNISFENNPTDVISKLKDQGYELVSDDWGNGLHKYQSDDSKNDYEVHFKHATKTTSYSVQTGYGYKAVYEDGTPVTFNVNGKKRQWSISAIYGTSSNDIKIDLATGKPDMSFEEWKQFVMDVEPDIFDGGPLGENDQLIEVPGYTHDQIHDDKYPDLTPEFVFAHDGEMSWDTIVYHPIKEDASIKFIDDTTHKTLTAGVVSGTVRDTIKFGFDPEAKLNSYLSEGYELVSNNYKDNTNFSAESLKNQFEIHLNHGTVAVTPEKPGKPGTPINHDPNGAKYPDVSDTQSLEKDVTRTIHYVDSQGHKLRPDHVEHLHFKATMVIDRTNGKIISISWDGPFDFSTVESPVIPGYTADRASVSDPDVAFDHGDIVETVVYTANPVTHGHSKGMSNGSVASGVNGANDQNDKHNKLPQTGNDTNMSMLALGVASLASLFGLAAGYNKRCKD